MADMPFFPFSTGAQGSAAASGIQVVNTDGSMTPEEFFALPDGIYVAQTAISGTPIRGPFRKEWVPGDEIGIPKSDPKSAPAPEPEFPDPYLFIWLYEYGILYIVSSDGEDVIPISYLADAVTGSDGTLRILTTTADSVAGILSLSKGVYFFSFQSGCQIAQGVYLFGTVEILPYDESSQENGTTGVWICAYDIDRVIKLSSTGDIVLFTELDGTELEIPEPILPV